MKLHKHFFPFLKRITFILLLISGLNTYSQVGFNNPNPDSSALIDMKALDKGLLIPRMDSAYKTIMANKARKPAHSLLVFDLANNMFYFYDSTASKWTALNPFKAYTSSGNIIAGTTGNVGIGTNSPIAKLDVNGKVKATEFAGYGITPIGGIIMWSGSINSIPDGWALCNGANGTPNLSGRFVVGYDMNDPEYNATNKTGPSYTDADGTSSGNNTQDAKTIKLTAAQSGVPAHNHAVNDPGHKHTYLDNFAPQTGSGYGNGGNRAVNWNEDATRTSSIAVTGVNIQNNIEQNATQSFENRPPYYVLAYIIRIK